MEAEEQGRMSVDEAPEELLEDDPLLLEMTLGEGIE